MTGDINCPEIDRSDYHSSITQQHKSQIFLNKIQDSFLYQHVTDFTRYWVKSKHIRFDINK